MGVDGFNRGRLALRLKRVGEPLAGESGSRFADDGTDSQAEGRERLRPGEAVAGTDPRPAPRMLRRVGGREIAHEWGRGHPPFVGGGRGRCSG